MERIAIEMIRLDGGTQPRGKLRQQQIKSYADDMRAGLQHLALHVTDLDAIAGQLACAGVPFTIEPKNIPGGVRIAFFTDPDGTSIELIEGDLVFTRR